MKTTQAGDLDIAYVEHGPEGGAAVILLHGFPYDIHAFDAVAPILAAQDLRVLVPYLRGYGATTFRHADTLRSGQQAALAHDLLAFMDALGVQKATLAGYDWGGRAACIVAALWPERVAGLVSCGQGYNLQDIPNAWKPLSPAQEVRLWYTYYFNTLRGVKGLTLNRRALCQHIWGMWSPSWSFDQATFDATVQAFDNPDFVDVVIHSYRHRLGEVAGDPQYEATEALLAGQPAITVPSVVMLGADDEVTPPSHPDSDAAHFSGPYRRVLLEGVGHNLPQEAPEAFAAAILSL